MQHSPRLTRGVASIAAALPLAAALAVLPALATATPALAATGNYSGSAALDLIHANVNLAGQATVADAGVAPAQSLVNSAGLAAQKDYNGTTVAKGKQSFADGANINTNLLGSGQLGSAPLSEAEQTALPDNAKPAKASLTGTIPLNPLLTASVADATARARFTSAGCLPVGEPISTATSDVANAQLVPGATGLGTVVATQGVNNGAASTTSVVAIGAGGGITSRSLVSSGTTQVANINLLGGTVVVKVVGNPILTAVANGKPGGASVNYTPALLSVTVGGQVIPLNPGNPLPLPLALPNNPVLNLSIPVVTKTIASNGTSASGSAAILHLDVLSAAGTPLVNADIGRTNVSTTVPVGGIDCSVVNEDNPLREAAKDVSASTVNAGKTFDYSVTVPNRGDADITNVKVVDTVTPSTGISLVSAVPTPTSKKGNVFTFDLGTITPNQTKTILLTFKVADGTAIGTTYHNHADISGTYKGTVYTKGADVNGPSVDKAGNGPCNLISSNKASSHLKVVQGETFNYYVHVFNTGSLPCNGTKVTDVLEPTISFVSATHGGTLSGTTVTWNVGTVAPGASETLTVTVKTVAKSGTLHNKAHITADGATPADPEVNGPVVTDQSVLAPPHPAVRVANQDLAFTGLSIISTVSALVLVFLGLMFRSFAQSRRPYFRL